MNRQEFKEMVQKEFEKAGYTKIKIQPALFGNRGEVTARKKSGGKETFQVVLEKHRGKECLQVKKQGDPLGWIDELEAMDAIFEDED